ncbi:phenylacetic acid degradation protein paaN [Kineosphaera limosa]|uniref:phenylacetic acid degradation protein PaaN n=1 Tax=Kineosphaera limosa TaxID=111564 RepID=UPI0017F2D26C|nr:phenylacetic acid degradation protein PaaN [Kineosphaera limosa]NYE01525.1 phenylacetic acid degradation protein paaN [Kineosphaera limosa]
MTTTAAPTPTDAAAGFVRAHEATLEEAAAALAARTFYSRYPESPSPRVYGETAAADGLATYESYLGDKFVALGDQPADGDVDAEEVSPFGPRLDVSYPHLDVDAAITAALGAMPAWRDAGPRVRAAVCVEIVSRINARSFEVAQAVMHTSGQPFVMAFQAGGPHAQDRALEAIVAALVEQERVPTTATWEKPAKGDPIRMVKDFRIVPRGIALVIGCNTFPTWNAYPGLFASLATGNPVLVKPHPRAVLPLAITVAICREVLAEAGFDPALVQLAAEAGGEGLAKTLALNPAVKIIDYTGGPTFGAWLEKEAGGAGKLVYTEKAGVNSIVIDSIADPPGLRGLTGNLAFSFSLYSGQMCTAPQNVYIPRSGIRVGDQQASFEDVADAIGMAISKFTGDDAKAVEILGATVNDDVRGRATDIPGLAERLGGTVLLDSRAVAHPTFPDAVARTPALIGLDVADESAYTQECFGPVAFLIATDSTQQSLQRLTETIRQHGAMTAAVYSCDEEVLDAARDACAEAGVALSENLTGPVFVNQTAAFSDYHGTGANPAANSAYTDAAFVANRFRVVTSRRHV